MKCQSIFLAIACCLSFLLTQISTRASVGDDYWDDRFGRRGVQPNGLAAIVGGSDTVFAGGLFDTVDEVVVKNGRWTTVGGGLNGAVASLLLHSEFLYAGGFFTHSRDVPLARIAKWDGQQWSSLGAGADGGVWDIAADSTHLYIGGAFRSAGGISANHVAKWNGSEWSALGQGVRQPFRDPIFGDRDDAVVFALALMNGKLYVGGRFSHAGSMEARNIAVWDGQSWSALGEGIRQNEDSLPDGTVRTLAVIGTNLFVGGEFRFAGSIRAHNIARWDGSQWHQVGSDPNGNVAALTTAQGLLFAAGAFSNIGGVGANNIAVWDGNQWSPLGSGIGGGSVSGALASDGARVFLGGKFTTAGNKPSTNMALWHIPRTLRVHREASTVNLSWPKPDTNLVLQASKSLNAPSWSDVSAQPALDQNRLTVKEPLSGSQKFYRLRQR